MLCRVALHACSSSGLSLELIASNRIGCQLRSSPIVEALLILPASIVGGEQYNYLPCQSRESRLCDRAKVVETCRIQIRVRTSQFTKAQFQVPIQFRILEVGTAGHVPSTPQLKVEEQNTEWHAVGK